jgi:hypothetical protein
VTTQVTITDHNPPGAVRRNDARREPLHSGEDTIMAKKAAAVAEVLDETSNEAESPPSAESPPQEEFPAVPENEEAGLTVVEAGEQNEGARKGGEREIIQAAVDRFVQQRATEDDYQTMLDRR